MTLLHAIKLIAAGFGVFSAGCWAVSALGHRPFLRRILRLRDERGVPWFQATMNAYAAGAASIAAIAQVFLTLGD